MRGARITVDNVQDGTGIIPADAGSTKGSVSDGECGGDHPRGCGEHTCSRTPDTTCRGSSPRMRGAHVLNDLVNVVQVDHPRGCGEHCNMLRCLFRIRGSSPRMRGALMARLVLICMAGIIPADAGSTVRIHRWRKNRRDHPRGCGEHRYGMLRDKLTMGSSPRMRGALTMRDGMSYLERIIPADAGSTIFIRFSTSETQDHPRGCGEHLSISTNAVPMLGSSPRMRGAPAGACIVSC